MERMRMYAVVALLVCIGEELTMLQLIDPPTDAGRDMTRRNILICAPPPMRLLGCEHRLLLCLLLTR
jgi:hypothetical protein